MIRYFIPLSLWVAFSALQVYTVSGAEPDSLFLDSLRREADMLFARQDYDKAAGLYRKLIQADTLDSRAMALLGSCLMRTGLSGPAIELFTRALEIEPYLKLAFLGLVYSYYRLERFDSSRIWADSCRSILAGSEKDNWDKMLQEFFPLISRTEEE